MENQNFPVKVGGQVSFTVNNSEVGLYYEKQLDKNLSVAIAESNNVSLECGSGFDLDTFENLSDQIRNANAHASLLRGHLAKFMEGLGKTAMWTIRR